ncbi:hypothetical protein PRK78_002666 [Emydomyces testavorans]|uniref:CobW/HypB/UreG nucleotide-binding domain-containing protein n=1 Tax=Emydomyces testavorans TaxID=2070801 RepID=A0AAF0DER7_9EURO|nr:hypothetical protein PRK78_002666 [Emydomyces testavorans]
MAVSHLLPHDHSHSHSHAHDGGSHGHTHEILNGPGSYLDREMPMVEGRDWNDRAFTIGIGGPVGSGKTALMLQLCLALRNSHNIAAVTNDIFTSPRDQGSWGLLGALGFGSRQTNKQGRFIKLLTRPSFSHREDAEFLTRNNALPPERIRAIETGGCPHAAVREDISANLLALQQLQRKFHTDLLLIESGGDNLAANYSRELADYIIYVIDVAGGDKIPRKGGPGITGSDLLVVNKIDLAEAVGADLGVMERDAVKMREGGPTIFAEVKNGKGVEHIVNLIVSAWKSTGAYDISLARWKNGAPKGSGVV